MVVIRLARGGAKARPFFNIVVADKRTRRDGRFIERIGFYNPIATANEESIRIAQDRLTYWKGVGAQASPTVERLINQAAKKAAYQATGWVHQHVVADRIAFGVEALQDAQRALVQVADHAAIGFERVVQIESGQPSHLIHSLGWADCVTRKTVSALLALRAAVCPACGALFDGAEQFVHGHGHRAHDHQARKRQAHLHGRTGRDHR